MNEDTWTKPSEFCPNPELWESPDSEGTEYDVSIFIGFLVRMIKPLYVVETGTYHGWTTKEIGYALKQNGRGHLDSIEKDTLAYSVALRRTGKIDTIRLINGNTMDFVPIQNIDFGFFDSWQEGRYEEFLRYHALGKLKPGAIVAFHDTAPHHQTMKGIQKYLINPGYITGIQFHTPRGIYVGQVLK